MPIDKECFEMMVEEANTNAEEDCLLDWVDRGLLYAADRIEALEKENAELKKALELALRPSTRVAMKGLGR